MPDSQTPAQPRVALTTLRWERMAALQAAGFTPEVLKLAMGALIAGLGSEDEGTRLRAAAKLVDLLPRESVAQAKVNDEPGAPSFADFA